MVSILHEELESKVGKLRHMKLDVKQPKIKKKKIAELPGSE